jgi:hypothetical protein
MRSDSIVSVRLIERHCDAMIGQGISSRGVTVPQDVTGAESARIAESARLAAVSAP